MSDQRFGEGLADAVILSRSIMGLEMVLMTGVVYSISIMLLIVKERPKPAVSCTKSLAPVWWKEGIHAARSRYIFLFLCSHCPNIGLYIG